MVCKPERDFLDGLPRDGLFPPLFRNSSQNLGSSVWCQWNISNANVTDGIYFKPYIFLSRVRQTPTPAVHPIQMFLWRKTGRQCAEKQSDRHRPSWKKQRYNQFFSRPSSFFASCARSVMGHLWKLLLKHMFGLLQYFIVWFIIEVQEIFSSLGRNRMCGIEEWPCLWYCII